MIKVYGKPGCMQCKMTKKFLETEKVDFEYIDATKNKEALAYVKSLGYKSLPVTEYNEIHFFGFDIDKLTAITK